MRLHDSEDFDERRRGQLGGEDHPPHRRARLDEDHPRFSRRARLDDEPEPVRGGRFTEGERVRLAKLRDDAYIENQLPDGADRWSTWDDGDPGPDPRPGWLITETAAVDPNSDRSRPARRPTSTWCAGRCPAPTGPAAGGQAVPQQRPPDVPPGRRLPGGPAVRESREMRAMATRTTFGRNLIAEQWAVAEFAALSRLWTVGAPVPYPVQRTGTELLLEFLGDADGAAAPRLAQLRPGRRRAAGALVPAGGRAAADGVAGPGPRRPVGVQPAGPRRAAGADRPAPGGRRGGQPARDRVPRA